MMNILCLINLFYTTDTFREISGQKMLRPGPAGLGRFMTYITLRGTYKQFFYSMNYMPNRFRFPGI